MSNTIYYLNQSASDFDADIINDFVDKGKSVILFSGRIIEKDLLKSDVKIVKLKSLNRRTTLTRFFSWSIFTIQAGIRLLFSRNCSVFIVSNPPFAIFLPFILRLKNYALSIYDIYPDILIQYGYFSRKSMIYRMWAKVNKIVFLKARVVFTLGKGMKEVILTYSPEANIVINPLWTDNTHLKPIDRKENYFAKKYKIEENFVVMYSGNLGKTHDVEIIVDLAVLLKNYDTIKFVIIGNGNKKESIANRIQQNNLANCMLLPFQDYSVIPYSLSCADVAIITLSSEASKLSIPCKVYDMMAVGAAFLVIADIESDLAAIVEEYKIGKSFNPSQLNLMAEFLLKLKEDNEMLKYFKTNARKASFGFTKNNAKNYYQSWF